MPRRAGRIDEVIEDKGDQASDRPQGGAVPARHRDGLSRRPHAFGLRVQQPEPDLGLRLRRVGRAHPGGKPSRQTAKQTQEKLGHPHRARHEGRDVIAHAAHARGPILAAARLRLPVGLRAAPASAGARGRDGLRLAAARDAARSSLPACGSSASVAMAIPVTIAAARCAFPLPFGLGLLSCGRPV